MKISQKNPISYPKFGGVDGIFFRGGGDYSPRVEVFLHQLRVEAEVVTEAASHAPSLLPETKPSG